MMSKVKNVVNSVNEAVRDNQRVVAARKVIELAEARTGLLIRKTNFERLEQDFWAHSLVPDLGRGIVNDAYTVLLDENAAQLRQAVDDWYGL